ncbi:DNA/RNA non-specific endonuclease [Eisenibacter elegans]|jgi:endonuclease G|uniref:DNA/RNA non-specific endonuclease n=1 Tax=Eisenibacter elegans TaxID=997 RepID=UPI000688CD91|nr:DNA/RNA non-specific endonuclease [Eisenibacter elegans]
MSNTRKRKSPNTNTQRRKKSGPAKKRPVLITVIIALLVGGYWAYENNFLDLRSRLAGLVQPVGEETIVVGDEEQQVRDERQSPDGNARGNRGEGSFDINHPDFGLPAYSDKDVVVRHSAFALSYNEAHEQADWVAYRLKKNNLRGGVERTDDFRPDPKIPTQSATPADYRGSGYDRGHLAPAGDFKYSEKAMSETFFMSNMSPQAPDLNRGIWRILEEQIRTWVRRDGEYFIVTGPILKGGRFQKIGKNNVSVPKEYYKVILDPKTPKAIAFIMRNEGSDKDLQTFVVTIEEVERRTGIDFFPMLPNDLAQELEKNKRPELWFKK